MKKCKLPCALFLQKSISRFILLMFLAGIAVNAFAQTIAISGKVVDAHGEPIPGANIIIKGTTTGTATDFDGVYHINVPDPEAVLVFSFVGYATKEMTVGSQTMMNMILEESTHQLDAVVVIGYGTAKKRDLTGSIVSIKGDDVADKPSVNPLASIQGKVAGVQVVNTGRAGQDPEIRIRGTNSINGYTPLYVVDGLFSDNISYLNPADIESMEILKEPSSLAIIGGRGANGVIIITTKKAKEGQTLVNVNTSVGWKYIGDKVSLTNAADFKTLYNEQLINQGRTQPYDYTNWQADTNWQDEIFQTGFMVNANVSITGSTTKNKYYMSIGYSNEDGSIKTEQLKKVTLNLSSDYSMTDFLRFGFQFNGSRTLPPDAKNVTNALQAAPIAPVHDPTTGLLYTMPDFQRAQVGNPMIDIETKGRHNIGTNYRGAGNIYGEVDFLKHFNFKATFMADLRSEESRQYIPIIYVYNPDIPGEENTTDRETINQVKLTQLVAQADYILTYTNKWGDHGLTAMAGLTTNYSSFSRLYGARSQQIDDIIFSIPNGNPDKWWLTSIDETAMANNNEDNTQYQYNRFLMSYLVRALYNYKNKYLLNASYRRDGSSVFYPLGNTWDNFYSVGAGWVMSEEKFMKEQKLIDYLKFKGSWGVLGTQNTGTDWPYPAYPRLIQGASAVFGDRVIQGRSVEYLVQNLTWEKTYAWEAGFELSMFHQRLRIEPTYYHKVTKDIIVLLPPLHGTQNSLENLGKIRNQGVELSGSWNDKIGESGFTYSIGGNLTTIQNKVLTLGRSDSYAIYSGTKNVARSVAGQPLSYFYGYKVIGVYQNNEDIKQSPTNTLTSVAPGDFKFADISGPDGVPDGKITDADRTMIGNPTPDFTYGINVSLGYKGFDLTVDMMGVYGNEIYRTWDVATYAQLNYLDKRMNRWHGEGTSNWEPILDPSRSISQLNSSYFIEDGSFFRIRNIQLGYTFSPEKLKKAYIKSLRIYGNVQNPKTWTRNTGYVPEIGGTAIAFGIDNGTYPMPAIYTLGLNLTF